MSTYRFPLRGKIGVVRGLFGEVQLRLMAVRREQMLPKNRAYLYEVSPLTEEEVRNLPVAHRYSS